MPVIHFLRNFQRRGEGAGFRYRALTGWGKGGFCKKLLLQPDPSRWTLPLSSYLSMRQMAVLPRETVTTGKKYCTTRMMVRGMLSTVLSLFT
jgi:hypothetical protein